MNPASTSTDLMIQASSFMDKPNVRNASATHPPFVERPVLLYLPRLRFKDASTISCHKDVVLLHTQDNIKYVSLEIAIISREQLRALGGAGQNRICSSNGVYPSMGHTSWVCKVVLLGHVPKTRYAEHRQSSDRVPPPPKIHEQLFIPPWVTKDHHVFCINGMG